MILAFETNRGKWNNSPRTKNIMPSKRAVIIEKISDISMSSISLNSDKDICG